MATDRSSSDEARRRPAHGRPAGPAHGAAAGDQGILELLGSARRIAVVGASSNPARPSFGVFRTLLAAGYECVPVNPNETVVLGVPAVATLAEAAAAAPSTSSTSSAGPS